MKSYIRHDLVVKHVKISVFYVNVLFSFIGSVVLGRFHCFCLSFWGFWFNWCKKCAWKQIAYDETISMGFEVKCPLKEQMVKNIWIGMCYWNGMKSTRLCYKERISIEFDDNWTNRDWNTVFWIYIKQSEHECERRDISFCTTFRMENKDCRHA